jgi:hypothetical protein
MARSCAICASDTTCADSICLAQRRGTTLTSVAVTWICWLSSSTDRYLGLMVDLEDLLGRPVDLVSATSIRNPYFREELQRTRVPLYAA